jgi:asparagine N-glycosylation enzyme membrane subunit Stt3
MLLTLAVILLILWLLGFSMHLLGGFIHILLILAIIFFLVRVIQGRNPLK